jgi:hypothetical protein
MQVFDVFPNISVDGSSQLTDFGPGILGVIADIVYEEQVLKMLNDINSTFSGNELFNQIANANKSLVIVPFSKKDQLADPINAFAQADNQLTAEPLGLRHEGKGGGSNVHVHFSPDTNFASLGPIGSAPDEVLFHELVHALRQEQGELEDLVTGDQDHDYDDDEEFLAIVMANIYISEKTPTDPPPPLRKDHHGFNALPDEESTSVGFLLNNAENLLWIKWLFPEESDYFNAVAGNPFAVFNPIREYVINQPFYDSLGSTFAFETHTVVSGDTLSRIADQHLGDANKWRAIYNANRDVIGPNPNLIFPGQVLKIPLGS